MLNSTEERRRDVQESSETRECWSVVRIREPLRLDGSTTLVAQYCDMHGVRHYHIGRIPKANPLANLTFCQKSRNGIVSTVLQDSMPELPTGESIRDILVEATPGKQILLTYDVPMSAPYEKDVRMFLKDVVERLTGRHRTSERSGDQ